MPLAIGLVLGQIVGGYVGVFLGNRFAFAGAVAGIVLMISLTNFITSTFAVWIVRPIQHLSGDRPSRRARKQIRRFRRARI